MQTLQSSNKISYKDFLTLTSQPQKARPKIAIAEAKSSSHTQPANYASAATAYQDSQNVKKNLQRAETLGPKHLQRRALSRSEIKINNNVN